MIENRQPFYTAEKENGTVLRAGQAASFRFTVRKKPQTAYSLMIVGETRQQRLWKDEPDEPMQYRSVQDALDAEHARLSQYCLNFSSEQPRLFPKRVYKKVLWPPVQSYVPVNPVPETWQAGVWVKTENVRIHENGSLKMRVDVRYASERDRHDSGAEPDEIHEINFPENTDWTCLSCELNLPKEKIAHVGVWLEGKNYEGKVYLERPFLQAEGTENLLPEFTVPVMGKCQFDWIGQNVSCREWPEFSLILNGEQVFSGEVFERCHTLSEWSASLPPQALADGENVLEIRYESDYHDPLPYEIHELALLEKSDAAVEIAAVSPFVPKNGTASVLIKTKEPHTTIRFGCPSGALRAEDVTFNEPGLHGLKVFGTHCQNDVPFSLEYEHGTVSGTLSVIEKEDDGVITGTGDMIYIHQDEQAMEDYLCWYFSSGIGNMITVRPTYRWSGSRVLSEKLWRNFARLMKELGVKYALMMDGRELPGINCNPPEEWLAGENFLGRQMHEEDGRLFYWGNVINPDYEEEEVADMMLRMYREEPEAVSPTHGPGGINWQNDRLWPLHLPDTDEDYRAIAERRSEQLQRMRGNIARHTGPSMMFDFFFQNGFSFLGMESMYSSIEMQAAFLRGACETYGKTRFGAHHAMQWSSSPYDREDHYRRYRLALYLSYMLGTTDINTEEGLWHIEENYTSFHRFSDACVGHLKQQQDFYRYTASHTRRGTFYAPVAFMRGRLDGFMGFTGRTWGLEENDTDAEKSWALLKEVYPACRLGLTLYFHGTSGREQLGYYSATPYGHVNVVSEIPEKYRYLIFAGYHCAEPGDKEQILAAAEKGCTVLLSRAHLATVTDRKRIRENDLEPLPLFEKTPCAYAEGHVNGTAVSVCVNPAGGEVLAVTDEGWPLMIRYAVGCGEVLLVNAVAYPAHPAIEPLYTKTVQNILKKAAAEEKSFVETAENVGFTVYDLPDGTRVFYLLAVDWYHENEGPRTAVLRVGEKKIPVTVPRDTMIKIAVKDGCGVITTDENGEILAIEGTKARVQGQGTTSFVLLNGQKVTVDFSKESVQEITL